MKLNSLTWMSMMSAMGVAVGAASAQETNELEQLRREMREMREKMRLLEQKLLEQRPAPAAESAAAPPEPTAVTRPWSPADPIRIGKGAAYADIGLVATFAAGSSTANDIEGGTQLGGHDPNQRGFTVQGVEMNLQGAVDPYFRGNANILFSVDSDGESFVELEEAWLETVSLPWNLQLRAGQVLTDYGRINAQHPHAWSFVDTPLVNGRFFGPDGLRNPGGRFSWLAPTPFYSEWFLTVQDSHGETATSFRSAGHAHGGDEEEEDIPFAFRHADNDRGVGDMGDLLFTPRYALSFDLTPNQVLLLGASAAFGPNSRGGEDTGSTDTQIYGLDLTWKWKSPRHHGGFPFVTWQTEAMLQKYDAGAFDWDENGNGVADEGEIVNTVTGLPARLPGETLSDYGFYTQWLYGFRKGWVAGLRFDYVASDRGDYERLPLIVGDGAGGGDALGRDPMRAQRWRVSPNLTWYPSEFSKIRLQYNYDDRRGLGSDHSIWLQFEFLLGAHAAHKF